MATLPGTIPQKLSRVLWIGGSPCSGKSSIARMLAEKHGLQEYKCDIFWEAHTRQAHPDRHPLLHRLLQMTWDEIWMRPVEELVRDEIGIYREEFGMIVEDLLALPDTSPILVEGSALLPDCIRPLLADLHQAVWVVPTEVFQRQYYTSVHRPWIREILSQCRDPQQAYRNWMARDIEFATFVAQDAGAHGMKVLRIDGRASIAENCGMIERHFSQSKAPLFYRTEQSPGAS